MNDEHFPYQQAIVQSAETLKCYSLAGTRFPRCYLPSKAEYLDLIPV